MMIKKIVLVLMAVIGVNALQAAENDLKPRLVVCTDIAPADVEPDDMESMVRLMAYADMFEIEALITSVGWNCDPYPAEWAEYLQRVIEAYRKDVPKLMRRSGQQEFMPLEDENKQQYIGYWPSADYVKSRAVMGSIHGGIKAIGADNDSPGSELLIRLADEDDTRPIYVAAWGGANTLAQAIWQVKQTRSAEELKKFVHKFRIYTITDQDMQYSMRMNRSYSSHMWLRKEFADDLQFVWDEGTWQEQCELGKRHWQQHKDNIQGRGALGGEYPTYKWGVEGDTPSFLYVMPNGLNNPEDPHQCGWAGYHERGMCADSLTTAWTSWQEPVRSISVGYKQRFYPDELNDFMARMQWAAEGKGNLNPYVVIPNDTINITVTKKKKVKKGTMISLSLDASKSFDPDGDNLQFSWWQQPEIGKTKVKIEQADQPIATLRIPADAKGDTIHIICEVHDDGPYHLPAYRRIIIKIDQPTIARIQNRGTILIGTTGDYRPLTFREADGTYWGFGIDMAGEIAKRLGVGIEFVQTSWPTLSADVQAEPQTFDLAIGGITITDARRETMLMSDGYLHNGKTILCRASEADRYKTLADIDKPEVRVMVNPGGLNEKFANENLTHATIIVHQKNEEIPSLIAEGEADVMITEITEAPYYIQTDTRLVAPLMNAPFTNGEIGVLMRKGQDDLLQLVNDVISQMKTDGTLRQLQQKYGLKSI
ncbi:MAG: DUF1593 domain-containing protein [Bacteroidales bacterium]|nr:DUF1593 domain-containing protein [Bacteroidales bacterium]